MTSGHTRSRLQALAIALVMIVGVAFITEGVLEFLQARKQARKARPGQSYYSWSFLTPDGTVVSTQAGPLKLMIHPKVGYVNFPNQRTEQFSINSRGFRGGELRTKGAAARRIVVLGGSTAFGTGLPSDADSFAAQLEQKLGDAEVINAAVIGHRSGQELAYLVSDIMDLEPDLILALDGYNDYGNRLDEPWIDFNGAGQIDSQLRSLRGFTYAGPLTRVANLPRVAFARIAERVDRARAKLTRGGEDLDADAQARDDAAFDAALAQYVTNVSKMHRIAGAISARFVCVLQPSLGWVVKRDDGRYAEFRALAARALAQAGVEVLDLNLGAAGSFEAEMFMDEIHLDAAGNRVMVEAFAAREHAVRERGEPARVR